MRLLPILFLTLFFILSITSGCGRREEEIPCRTYEDGLTTRAWFMLDTGAPFEEYFRVQEEAVRRLRSGESREDPVAVLEQTAYFLFSAGRLEEALPYFNEALDSLRGRPGLPASECAVQLYGDLSQFYERLGMNGKAIEYSDSAIAVSKRTGGVLLSDVWTFRTQIYANEGRTDEAFACLDSAREAILHIMEDADTALLLAVVDAERANIIFSRNPSPDSVDLAVSLLRNIEAAGEGHDFTDYDMKLGYGLYRQGHKTEGIRMMEAAMERIRGFGDLELTYLELRRLIEVYTNEKMYDKVSANYNEYTLLEDSMSRARHNLELVSAKVRADVAAKERENRTLQEKLKNKHRQNTAILAALVVFAAAAALATAAGRRHYLRMKHRRDAERARRISAEAEFSEAASERDSALERLKTIKSSLSEPESSFRDILKHPRAIGKDQGRFLRTFNAVHPHFTDNLRTDYPALTDTDIIFCILIYLEHSSEEIAVYLNISHASVNSARYRIRSKLGLAKGENLDKFLREREA